MAEGNVTITVRMSEEDRELLRRIAERTKTENKHVDDRRLTERAPHDYYGIGGVGSQER